MNFKSVFSDRALQELADSWTWYEEQQHGLGDRFTDTILKTIQQLEENPAKGLSRSKIYKEAIVRTFPFLVIYRIDTQEKTIFIHSIFHSNRNPKKKYRG